MDRERTQKILRAPKVLRALVSEIDNDPGELIREGYGHRLVAGRPNDTPMADIYMATNGGVYVIAYSIGPGNPEHLALYAWASQIAHKVVPYLEEHDARIITVAEDSIEITGLPAVSDTAGLLDVLVNKQGVFFKHFDIASSALIRELLALLRGENSNPNTELGRAVKEALG